MAKFGKGLNQEDYITTGYIDYGELKLLSFNSKSCVSQIQIFCNEESRRAFPKRKSVRFFCNSRICSASIRHLYYNNNIVSEKGELFWLTIVNTTTTCNHVFLCTCTKYLYHLVYVTDALI